ncbi:alpha/beta fold hydrolase [Algoriphagus sp. A40]|uniref:alpha/beta fold hydrolase n=1 Tax=Algoriphagus sp. A40 TaxID=1945863 RepID=UPI000985090E|nr:alpha/beta hydrolase [Algoriphagus sp. A40]OOG77647.1 alpha/beta hydrolase [Algoriphagus sp. A40]
MNTTAKGYDLIIPVNTINLSYDDLGEGNIPVIFLHGFPFDKSMWKGQLEFFASSYRVIALDIRGFGKSKDEESSLSIDLFANDLIHFMDALNLEKAIVCGLSMGGYILLNAQERYPDRFEALILCDTQCIADSNVVKEKRLEAIQKIESHGPDKFNEGFVKSVFHKNSLTEKEELVENLSKVVFSNSKHIIAEGLRALSGRSETCSTLSEIAAPTLIICGRADEVTPLAQSESMHQVIEGSELKVIENAGHVSNLEQPEDFNSHLQKFLAGITFVGAELNNEKKTPDSGYYGN